VPPPTPGWVAAPNVNTTTPDSLDARLFPSVVLPVAPAVTMDEASSLSPGDGLGSVLSIHIIDVYVHGALLYMDAAYHIAN